MIGVQWHVPMSGLTGHQAARARVHSGEGFIYLARRPGTPVIKIGFSLNPELRIKNMWSPYPRRLVLLCKIPGSLRQEQEIHRTLGKAGLGINESEHYRSSALQHEAVPEAFKRWVPKSKKRARAS